MDDSVFKEVYATPGEPGSFSGPEKLQQSLVRERDLEVPIDKIKKWMKGNETYTKYRIARRNFKRNPIIASEIDGIKYLLVLIDIVSKFVWVEPLKSKSGPSVKLAFERIWDKTSRRPKKLQTDDGKEFLYKGVQDMLRKMNIVFFTVKSDKKAAVAERVIRTLKDKIHRYLHEKHRKKYIDVLQELVASVFRFHILCILSDAIHAKQSTTPITHKKGKKKDK